MATQQQAKTFINKLSKLAIAECEKRKKKVLPSVCIAQAALETGYGTSSLMNKANAYFGIKATATWKGKVYNSKTRECYDGKTYTNITACFRAYDNVADSVADYYDLITNNSRYAAAVNETDAKTCITAIKRGGYATDPTYISKVMSIIKRYDLTQYDDVMTARHVMKVTTGKTVRLNKASLYTSSTARVKARTITGDYYIWSNIPVNGRYRITNMSSRVGVSGQVTGWIPAEYVTG